MANIMRIGLVGLALFWTVLITALVGNAIAIRVGGSPSAINFAMFVAILSWLTIIFSICTSMFLESLVMISVIAEAVVAAFALIAGIVLAAKLGVHSCGNAGYLVSNSLISGSTDPSKRCHELQASTAFFWFLFITYAVAAFLAFFSGSSGMAVRGGGIRKGGPSMSQV